MLTNIYSLNHASLIVANLDISLKFYREILGLQQVDRPDLGFPGAWFQLGDQQIHLLELENPDPITGRPEHGGRDRHVALNAISLTPLQDILNKAGIVYTMSKSGRRALFCRDPDGNAIEIIERI
ncbi:MAG: VOC family protein [Methylococcaceae bacterium]|jgi:glyoxylase I family protein|nr:VOC family protein [Methylococcaceae bacterium]MDD1630812.1 VOC family protein [Methylococcaceae bacterium]MDD1637540.1 VOC family protein [Methylococcaceae bacterium]MDD1642538.1 VOC family protein [Methylococcaceae bacterium]OYV20697.1 MAG: glyoxalase/bleomycin resistance protein/dioxygenase [Methylococcaceae bacterium NSM2-1]